MVLAILIRFFFSVPGWKKIEMSIFSRILSAVAERTEPATMVAKSSTRVRVVTMVAVIESQMLRIKPMTPYLKIRLRLRILCRLEFLSIVFRRLVEFCLLIELVSV